MPQLTSTGLNTAAAIRKSKFDSLGTSCASTFYLPAGRVSTSKSLPAILLIYGWGGVQTSFLPPFRDHFLSLGFAVMTFDFRSWGESDGHPRHVISVRDRIADAEAALNHLKQQPEVDPSSIVIWGSSLGGGIACTLADRHPELLGTIAQVPMLDGRAASSATPLFRRLRLLMYAFVDLLRSDKPLYIPIVSEPGQLSTMNRDGAARAKEESAKLYGPGAPNYVAARSALTMLTYRPIKSLGGIQVPTLLIGGTRDTVAPFNNRAVQKTCSPKLQIKILDVNHFEPYLPPFLEPNLSIQTEFLNNLLHS